MTSPTPEDRLSAVESHIYTVQALTDALEGLVLLAHLTGHPSMGFLLGFLVERQRAELNAAVAAAAADRTLDPSRRS